MKTYLSSRATFRALATAAALLMATAVQAQSVATDPVGATTLTLKGGSDTLVSLPFHRPVALETQVQSISGNIITLPASANLTANQFVYNSSTQTNTYYVQFLTGNKEGMYYTVTANDVANITVNNNNDATLATNVTVGDILRVIPYWTLNTVFSSGASLYSSNTTTPLSEILTYPTQTAGINLPPAVGYFYYTGPGGPLWLKAGDITGTPYPDIIFPPDSSFIVRHPIGTADTQLVLLGNVPMSAQAIILNNLAPNTAQDNFVALAVPVAVTLGNSGLSAIMAPSTTTTPLDELLVFDPTQVGQNKPPSAGYFYYTGPGGPFWLKAGDISGTPYDTVSVLQPGNGYIIRRAARSSAGSTTWTFAPPYLTP